MSQSAFDSSAQKYDEEFTNSNIGVLQRQRVYKYLLPLLKKSDKLLEINCGTGYDAILLSNKVNFILATDISKGMINVARGKIAKTNVSNVQFESIDIRTLQQSIDSNFDLVFSNFGGLNCLTADEIKKFGEDINVHLQPKAKLVLVLMGKKCWLENLWFIITKDVRFNRRNSNKGLLTKINESTFYTYYYSPHDLLEMLKENFTVSKIRPIGFFLPPSYLEPFFKTKKWLLFLFKNLENVFCHFSFMSNYADHYIIVLEKK